MLKVGLRGYGKTGQAVAHALSSDPRFDLRWIAHRTASIPAETLADSTIPVIAMNSARLSDWLDAQPADRGLKWALT